MYAGAPGLRKSLARIGSPRISCWALQDSNLGPRDYEGVGRLRNIARLRDFRRASSACYSRCYSPTAETRASDPPDRASSNLSTPSHSWPFGAWRMYRMATASESPRSAATVETGTPALASEEP